MNLIKHHLHYTFKNFKFVCFLKTRQKKWENMNKSLNCNLSSILMMDESKEIMGLNAWHFYDVVIK